MGSSRSAKCCRSPRRPITLMLPSSADPAKRSARAKRDAALKPEVRRVFDDNFQVYGVRKVWRQLKREGFDVARCTVERLMQSMNLQGVIRGKPVRTTISDKSGTVPTGSREPTIPGAAAERAVGFGLHLRCDLDRLRLRRLCDRCLCPPYRGLACQSDGPCRLRARRPGASSP